MSTHVPFIHTNSGVTLVLDGKSHTVATKALNYKEVITALKSGDLKKLAKVIDVRKAISVRTQGKVTVDGNGVFYDGQPVHSALASRIVEMLREGFNVTPFTKFMENLMANPSKRAVDELYSFLEACNLPITADGHFLAYKRVRNDYKDIHSGTMDNSVGKVLSMARNKVDEDKNRTCSAGLHFCSKTYLPHFGAGSGSRVVVVKINPADVVAIPADYNNAKGRTCRYEVVDELPLDEAELLINELSSDFSSDYSEWADDGDLNEVDDYAYDDYAYDENDEVEDTKDDTDSVRRTYAVMQTQPTVGSKLTARDVRGIRNMLDDGATLAAIARAYNVSSRQVARIRDGEAWADVT